MKGSMKRSKLDLFDTDPLILGNLLVNAALINITLLPFLHDGCGDPFLAFFFSVVT